MLSTKLLILFESSLEAVVKLEILPPLVILRFVGLRHLELPTKIPNETSILKIEKIKINTKFIDRNYTLKFDVFKSFSLKNS